MIIDDVMTDKITLHGLGFVQVQLQGQQRYAQARKGNE